MEHGQAGDAATSLSEYIDSMYGLVEPPLEKLVRAEDKLRTCMGDLGTVIYQVNIWVADFCKTALLLTANKCRIQGMFRMFDLQVSNSRQSTNSESPLKVAVLQEEY